MSYSTKHFFILITFIIFIVFGAVTFVRAQTTTDIVKACVAQPGSNSQAKNIVGKSNTGSVRIVSSENDCRNGEVYITWNVQGPSGPPGPPGSGGSQFIVVDSQNQEVGPLIALSYVLRKIGDYWVNINVTSNGLEQQTSMYVNYASTDCSGIPHLDVGGMARPGMIVGNKVYYAGDPLIHHYNSYRLFTPPNSYGECNQDSVDLLLGPVQSYELPTFVPPFSFRTSP